MNTGIYTSLPLPQQFLIPIARGLSLPAASVDCIPYFVQGVTAITPTHRVHSSNPLAISFFLRFSFPFFFRSSWVLILFLFLTPFFSYSLFIFSSFHFPLLLFPFFSPLFSPFLFSHSLFIFPSLILLFNPFHFFPLSPSFSPFLFSPLPFLFSFPCFQPFPFSPYSFLFFSLHFLLFFSPRPFFNFYYAKLALSLAPPPATPTPYPLKNSWGEPCI